MDPTTADKLLARSVGIRQAERAANLRRVERQAELNHRLAKMSQDAWALRAGVIPPEDDHHGEEAVHVGDLNITEAPAIAARVGPWPVAAAFAVGLLSAVLGSVWLSSPPADPADPAPPAPVRVYDIRKTPAR